MSLKLTAISDEIIVCLCPVGYYEITSHFIPTTIKVIGDCIGVRLEVSVSTVLSCAYKSDSAGNRAVTSTQILKSKAPAEETTIIWGIINKRRRVCSECTRWVLHFWPVDYWLSITGFEAEKSGLDGVKRGILLLSIYATQPHPVQLYFYFQSFSPFLLSIYFYSRPSSQIKPLYWSDRSPKNFIKHFDSRNQKFAFEWKLPIFISPYLKKIYLLKNNKNE